MAIQDSRSVAGCHECMQRDACGAGGNNNMQELSKTRATSKDQTYQFSNISTEASASDGGHAVLDFCVVQVQTDLLTYSAQPAPIGRSMKKFLTTYSYSLFLRV